MTHLADCRNYRVKRVADAVALIGAEVGSTAANIGVVTSAETQLTLPFGCEVRTVTGIKWVSIPLARTPEAPAGAAEEEARNSALVRDFAVAGLHYYSEDCDLSRPFPPTAIVADPPGGEWQWNAHLAGPFAKAGLGEWCCVLLQGVAIGHVVLPPSASWEARVRRFYRRHNPDKLADVPGVMAKYQGREEQLLQKLVDKYGPEPQLHTALITRRSSGRPGTRYNARGIDPSGSTANELECELLLWADPPPDAPPTAPVRWMTHVWRRGTVPLRWRSELAGKMAVGQASFVVCDDPFAGSELYFDALVRRYTMPGAPPPAVHCVSLLQTDPEHGELKLAESFQGAMRAVRKLRPALSVDILCFEWHRMVKQFGLATAVKYFWTVISRALMDTGFYSGECWVEQEVPAPLRRALAAEREAAERLRADSSRRHGSPQSPRKPGAFGKIRGLVSMQKIRLQEDGFDLDLTYITPRMIAMGFPSHGAEGYYRNPVDEVERFFETRHAGHYRIYNLCSEREYDSGSRFGGAYRRWPFDDHNAPAPLSMLTDIARDAQEFLDAHPENVIAAHCKAGKGRTGVVICCMLMCGMAPDVFEGGCTAAQALGYFSSARTKDGLGVTIPSQRRYVGYFESIATRPGYAAPPPKPVRIVKIVVQSPVKASGGPPSLYMLVNEGPRYLRTTPGQQEVDRGPSVRKFDSRTRFPPQPSGRFTVFDLTDGGEPPVVRGDVKVSFCGARSLRGDENLFHLWFHTHFVTPGPEPMRFAKAELDRACKDEHHKAYRRDLQVEVYFEEASEEEGAGSPSGQVDEDEEFANGVDDDGADAADSPGQSPQRQCERTPSRSPADPGGGAVPCCQVGCSVGERQPALLRINCVDSLDRTNLAGFFMALQLAAEMARRLCGDDGGSFSAVDKELAEVRRILGEDMVDALAGAFLVNGDTCSLLYTNTPATHTEAIRECSPRLGKAISNATLSIMRRYQNTVVDSTRHDTILAFLGRRGPASGAGQELEVLTSPLAAVVRSPEHVDAPAGATPLLCSPAKGGDLWAAPAGSEPQLIIALPAPAHVREVALCFRRDPAGGDAGYPAAFTVCTGSHLDTLQPVLLDAVIPRAPDATWLGFDAARRRRRSAPIGEDEQGSPGGGAQPVRFVRISFARALLPRHSLIFGGIRVLGHFAHRDSPQPPAAAPAAQESLARWPWAGFAEQVAAAEGAMSAEGLLQGHPEHGGEWRGAGPGAQRLVICIAAEAQVDAVSVSAAAPCSVTARFGGSAASAGALDDPRVTEGPLAGDLPVLGEGTADGSTPCVLTAQQPSAGRVLVLELAPQTPDGVVALREVAVDGVRVSPPTRLPRLPPASKLGCEALRRNLGRTVASGTDEEMLGAHFVAIHDTASSIAGVRIVSCGAESQAAGLSIGVAEASGVREIPCEQARTAQVGHVEEFAVPRCPAGTPLDFLLRFPARGTLARIEAIGSGTVSARSCVVLLTDD
eukprot:TRINITY_DN70124_c0_g1_i1.p1 TRINITY_DN70124_c0_g1~~TRINITY_DN70124_c0_g1_i1.p1  ORF type:complete len:1598 (+),score=505.70 TRINITY_DN70124_c0_g1_i1:362-4795(+)